MQKWFDNRNIGFWLSLAAAVLAFVGAILYIILDGSDKERTFSMLAFIVILASACSVLLVVGTRWRFASMIPTTGYIIGFSIVLRCTVPSVSDVLNKVNFIGGNAAMGVLFSCIFLICSILGCISCFLGQSKEEL